MKFQAHSTGILISIQTRLQRNVFAYHLLHFNPPHTGPHMLIQLGTVTGGCKRCLAKWHTQRGCLHVTTRGVHQIRERTSHMQTEQGYLWTEAVQMHMAPHAQMRNDKDQIHSW